jgi:hypothetical protein
MTASPPLQPKTKRGKWRILLRIFVFLVVLAAIPTVYFSVPVLSETTAGQSNDALQHARDISVALFSCSQDNDGKYPEGKSSTEIFQKLLDDKYVSDASIFYYPMPGKIKAAQDAKTLKPENVGFDVTCCVDDQSPDLLPVVFLTTYKVTYQPGANAVPLQVAPRSWGDWWNARRYPRPFLVVAGKNQSSTFMEASPDGTILHFIPADFDFKGRAYRQLTPDGELAP